MRHSRFGESQAINSKSTLSLCRRFDACDAAMLFAQRMAFLLGTNISHSEFPTAFRANVEQQQHRWG